MERMSMSECAECGNTPAYKFDNVNSLWENRSDTFLCQICHDKHFVYLERKCLICGAKHRSCCC